MKIRRAKPLDEDTRKYRNSYQIKRLWADESFDKKRDNTTTSNQAPFANNPLRRKHSKQQKGEGRAAQDPLPLSLHLRRDDALQRRSAATLRLTLSLALPPPPCTALRRRLPRGGVVLAAGPAAATAAATARRRRRLRRRPRSCRWQLVVGCAAHLKVKKHE